MNSLDKAIQVGDFNTIAGVLFNGRKEVNMPRPIQVLYTPTKYQIKVKRVEHA